jgi:hypothetical protein
MTSQELPVPPPPKDGKEHTDKQYEHETKAGKEENAKARTSANGRYAQRPPVTEK